ncbi:MAG: hypothetical protein ACT4PV_15390 [Planctomycetaceae bacterium]
MQAALRTLADGSAAHGFQSLLAELATTVRNEGRRRGAPDEPTFDLVTQANVKRIRALDLPGSISV